MSDLYDDISEFSSESIFKYTHDKLLSDVFDLSVAYDDLHDDYNVMVQDLEELFEDVLYYKNKNFLSLLSEDKLNKYHENDFVNFIIKNSSYYLSHKKKMYDVSVKLGIYNLLDYYHVNHSSLRNIEKYDTYDTCLFMFELDNDLKHFEDYSKILFVKHKNFSIFLKNPAFKSQCSSAYYKLVLFNIYILYGYYELNDICDIIYSMDEITDYIKTILNNDRGDMLDKNDRFSNVVYKLLNYIKEKNTHFSLTDEKLVYLLFWNYYPLIYNSYVKFKCKPCIKNKVYHCENPKMYLWLNKNYNDDYKNYEIIDTIYDIVTQYVSVSSKDEINKKLYEFCYKNSITE